MSHHNEEPQLALAADALQAAIEAVMRTTIVPVEVDEDDVQTAIDTLHEWGFEVRSLSGAPSLSVAPDVPTFLRSLTNERGHIKTSLDRAIAEYDRLRASTTEPSAREVGE